MAAFNQDWSGDRIELSNEGTIARRTASYNGGIVYSSEPIETNEIFQVRIDTMEMGWAGSLKFGVTTRCPIDQTIPKGILELYNRDDFWVLSGDKLHHDHKELTYEGPSLESLTRGDTVGLYVSSEGELHFLLKGDHAVKSLEIPTDRDVYVVADIYGQVKQISIDDSVSSVLVDTPMTEVDMSSRKSAGALPSMPSPLVAARALRAAATTHAIESASAPAVENSWKFYVHQQAHIQRELRENDLALAELHRHHLASLFGTQILAAEGKYVTVQAQDVKQLLEQYKRVLEQTCAESAAANESEGDAGSDSADAETTG
ncbi:neuralized-like protein 4 [Sycon ciliatum]|uniref:neuralized-like protein 4 n=1 Tax=Sycon ciliatum TaxID=27933 RepID=UPI0020AE2C84|eukprot:scpid76140/ scgid33569/ Neuralized-like protein 4